MWWVEGLVWVLVVMWVVLVIDVGGVCGGLHTLHYLVVASRAIELRIQHPSYHEREVGALGLEVVQNRGHVRDDHLG